ncbi:hypothetical protein BN946_scf184908.g165 [Trametes cinnabarina]|uniref:Uncharacterized protein n=1 Tax=Pycnoporus cinnabarinus TaxID=5643 RepID=A0A060SA87_PYCCI|nr:hypothetical protein BN946_scf184908.g165 [Trametes cinnabarina]
MPPRVHPIDHSCLQRYVTSRRICHAISAAYSTNLNPRNLEVDWLSPYNHIFSDLVDFMFDGALTIRQQYDLWLSKSTLDLYKLLPEAFKSVNKGGVDSDSDNNSAEDTVVPLDIPPVAPHAAAPAVVAPGPPPPAAAPPAPPIHGAPTAEGNNPAIADDPSDANLVDASFATIGTVPDNKGRDEFPDLLVCHTHALIMPQPTTEAKIHGWERHHAIAISAAGPYWRWIEVRREEVDEDVLNEDDLEKHKVFMKWFAKAHIYALGSDESDAELTRLRDEALIPILEQHPTYPSTMVSNPQRS